MSWPDERLRWGTILAAALILSSALILYPDTSPRVAANSGGPDGYGYEWYDDQPPGPTCTGCAWVDGETGATGDFNLNGDATATISLGFTMPFYGNYYSSVNVCENGWISFNAITNCATVKRVTGIPQTPVPNNLIAVWWEDLFTSNANRIYYKQELALTPARTTIYWDDVPQDTFGGGGGTFEIVLHANGKIWVNYQTVTYNTGYPAHAGIENSNGMMGLGYPSALQSNLLIEFAIDRIVLDPNQQGTQLPGLAIDYLVQVKNLRPDADTIDLQASSTRNWPTSFYQADGVTPLTDTDADTVVDTGLLASGAQLNVTMRVSVPGAAIYGMTALNRVWGNSSLSSKSDTVDLTTTVPVPDVGVTAITAPAYVNVGSVVNFDATIRNFSNHTFSFTVRARVFGPVPVTVLPNTVQPVNNLAGGATTPLSWSFTASTVGDYQIEVMTMLPSDQAAGNNVSTWDLGAIVTLFDDDADTASTPTQQGLWNNTEIKQGTRWQWGTPTNVGPTSCASPPNCWGTNIAANYNNAIAQLALVAPDIDLTTSSKAVLIFSNYYNTEFPKDGGAVFVRNLTGDDANWKQVFPDTGYPSSVQSLFMKGVGSNLPGYTGLGTTWTSQQFNLNGFVENVIQIAWFFSSDSISGVAPGWYLDDIFVGGTPRDGIIVTPNRQGWGISGDVITYNLTVRNLEASFDTVDLFPSTPTPGWSVQLFQADAITPLTDTDGDGDVDTGPMMPMTSFDFTAKVTVPFPTTLVDLETSTVLGRSSANLSASDTATIETYVFPHLEVGQTISTSPIYVNGTGVPDVSTVSLSLLGIGWPTQERRYQDTVFMIDRSGSMGGNDPGNQRITAAQNYLGNLVYPDRVTAIGFASIVWFAPDQTNASGHHIYSPGHDGIPDYNDPWNDIGTLAGASGGTNIVRAVSAANWELITYGDPTKVLVEILLTDGADTMNTNPNATLIQLANEAAANNITIYTIGLIGSGFGVDTWILQQIANITGGNYYAAPDPSYLEQIYDDIASAVNELAAMPPGNVQVTPYVEEILPPYISYVPGTFVDPKTGSPRDPLSITVDGMGTHLLWNPGNIRLREEWPVTFDIKCESQGSGRMAALYPNSRVHYLSIMGFEIEAPFPQITIDCILPGNQPPPLLPPSNLMDAPNGANQDIVLNWDPSPTVDVQYYEIYGGPTPYGIDFTARLGRTVSTETTWTDLGAAATFGEFYYTVTAVNASAGKSTNTNTAGKYTANLAAGLNFVSLPLEPFGPLSTAQLATQMGATSIEYLSAGDWVGTAKSTSLGEGYLVNLPVATRFSFAGLPAAHIIYNWAQGFDPSQAKPDAILNPLFGSLALTWSSVPGATSYRIYQSTVRDGFHTGSRNLLGTVTGAATGYTANGIVSGPGGVFVMVVPVLGGVEQSTSYSVGVETLRFSPMAQPVQSFGVPIRLDAWPTVDGMADQIAGPGAYAAGILWLRSPGTWVPHFRDMPANVYDAPVAWARAYQIQLRGLASVDVSFVGY